jgi:hypothetical protein
LTGFHANIPPFHKSSSTYLLCDSNMPLEILFTSIPKKKRSSPRSFSAKYDSKALSKAMVATLEELVMMILSTYTRT